MPTRPLHCAHNGSAVAPLQYRVHRNIIHFGCGKGVRLLNAFPKNQSKRGCAVKIMLPGPQDIHGTMPLSPHKKATSVTRATITVSQCADSATPVSVNSMDQLNRSLAGEFDYINILPCDPPEIYDFGNSLLTIFMLHGPFIEASRQPVPFEQVSNGCWQPSLTKMLKGTARRLSLSVAEGQCHIDKFQPCILADLDERLRGLHIHMWLCSPT